MQQNFSLEKSEVSEICATNNQLHYKYKYLGQLNDKGTPHGSGVKLLENGSMIEGFSLNGKMNGFGRQIKTDGSVFIGQ